MVNEVGKIIRNTLLSHGAVLLPSVGTLYIARKSAASIAMNRVACPEYRIEYTSDRKAISVVDAIAKYASLSIDGAKDIYMLWLDKVRKNDVVEIFSVGTLRNKSFIADDEFIAAINPCKGEIVAITKQRRRNNMVALYIAISAAIIAIAVGAYIFLYPKSDNSNNIATESPEITIVATEIPTTDSKYNYKIIATNDVSTSDSDIVTEVAEKENVDIIIENDHPWFEHENIRHYVVVGSYSSKRNAENALNDINSRNIPDVSCYRFMRGKMHTLAIYGSSDLAACEEFVALHKRDFPQAWVYSVEEN